MRTAGAARRRGPHSGYELVAGHRSIGSIAARLMRLQIHVERDIRHAAVAVSHMKSAGVRASKPIVLAGRNAGTIQQRRFERRPEIVVIKPGAPCFVVGGVQAVFIVGRIEELSPTRYVFDVPSVICLMATSLRWKLIPV